MQYDVKNPKEYLEQLDGDWRKETLLAIRQVLLKAYDFEEGIQYKMLSYGSGDNILFHLNAQANYVSLYVGNIDKVANAREMLKGLDLGKGCIRVKKSKNIENTDLIKFVDKAKDQWLQGHDLSC